MFSKLLPHFLSTADVARLAALVAAAQQYHDLPPVKSVVNAQLRTETDPQLKHAATDGFAIAKISRTHTGQTGIHRRLHPQIAEGVKPLVKRDESVLKLQLLDFPLKHFKCNL